MEGCCMPRSGAEGWPACTSCSVVACVIPMHDRSSPQLPARLAGRHMVLCPAGEHMILCPPP